MEPVLIPVALNPYWVWDWYIFVEAVLNCICLNFFMCSCLFVSLAVNISSSFSLSANVTFMLYTVPPS